MVTEQGFASYGRSAVRLRRAGLKGCPEVRRFGWSDPPSISNLTLSHSLCNVCEIKVNQLWFLFDGFQ
ncbi:hypothetical protein HanIR_Chr02g0084861 [Helianthus annuus]|nr:hypothetical protein HanIR_Chr02g0084861 [Helianthus annuus]